MNDHAATKLWAVIDEHFCAVTAGDTPADALRMYLGDTPDSVALCEDGCSATLEFDIDGGRVLGGMDRKGPDCTSGCDLEIHVEPLTEAHFVDPDRSSSLDYYLMTPNTDVRGPAPSDEEFNVKVAEKALSEARIAAGV